MDTRKAASATQADAETLPEAMKRLDPSRHEPLGRLLASLGVEPRPAIVRERLPPGWQHRVRPQTSRHRPEGFRRTQPTEPRGLRDPGLMASRAADILTTLALHRANPTVEMRLGSTEGPCRHYRRLALKRMQELGWLAVHRAHYNVKEQRVDRPSWVEVKPELAAPLAKVPIPSVPVGRPKQQPLRSLNRFIAEHEITGCPQVRLGFHAVDKEGSRYGRIHAACAHGLSFQTMQAKDRACIRFEDHPTVEVDLGSSQIRILASLMGQPLPAREDPYTVEGLEREAVKLWWLVTVFSANKRPPTNWEQVRLASITKQQHVQKQVDRLARASGRWPTTPFEITIAMHQRYPWLQAGRWDAKELVWIEGQVVLSTVEELAKQGVVALPVFDSIRVRVDQATTAEAVLRQMWAREVGAPCVVKRKHQGPEKLPAASVTIEGLVTTVMEAFVHTKLGLLQNICPSPCPSSNKTPTLPRPNLVCTSDQTNLSCTPNPHGGFRGYNKRAQRLKAQRLLASGLSITAVAKATGLHRHTVRKEKLKPSKPAERDYRMPASAITVAQLV